MNEDEQQAQYDREAEERQKAARERTLAERGLVDTGSQNVPGYRPQTEGALAVVKEVKHQEAQFGDFLRDIYFGLAAREGVALDPRQVASARTHLEYAFYHLNRAVFQPADPIGDAVKEGPRR
jgi:hypothetical protein